VLIASLVVGSAYVLAEVNQETGFYVMDVNVRVNKLQELSDSVPFTVVDGDVKLEFIPNTYVRILVNRLRGLDLIFNKALAGNVLELTNVEKGAKLSIGDKVINVPTHIEYLKAIYNDVGVLMDAYGKLRTVVVTIRGTWYAFGDTITYEFNIKTSGRYGISNLIQPTAFASAIAASIALLVTVFKDRDLAIVS